MDALPFNKKSMLIKYIDNVGKIHTMNGENWPTIHTHKWGTSDQYQASKEALLLFSEVRSAPFYLSKPIQPYFSLLINKSFVIKTGRRLQS